MPGALLCRQGFVTPMITSVRVQGLGKMTDVGWEGPHTRQVSWVSQRMHVALWTLDYSLQAIHLTFQRIPAMQGTGERMVAHRGFL